ncbi:MAG: hypothetical protein RIB84_21975 [Sneathiellaceae bacterium]
MTERLIADVMEGERRVRLYEENSRALEVFMEGMQGITVSGGYVKVNCYSTSQQEVVDGQPVERREVQTRLVMPLNTFVACAGFLQRMAIEIQNRLQEQANAQNESSVTVPND